AKRRPAGSWLLPGAPSTSRSGWMNSELKGRVALVTGAGRNIGRAIALALAEGGAMVVLNSCSTQSEIDSVAGEIAAKGGRALALTADVSREKEIETLVAKALETFGRLDILVNNAAIRAVEPIEGIGAARWRE